MGRSPFISSPISNSTSSRDNPFEWYVVIRQLVAFAHPKWVIPIELEGLTMPSVMNYFGEFTGGFDGTVLPHEQIHLTAVRRSMLTSPLYLKAHELLIRLSTVGLSYPKKHHEAKTELSSIVALVDNLIKTNPEMSETLDSLSGWLSSQSIKVELITLFDHVRLPGATITGRFVAIAYSVALWVHRSGGLPSDKAVQAATDLLASPAASTEKFRGALQNLSEDFIGHLIVEAEMRAREIPEFAQMLYDAERGFSSHFKKQDDEESFLDGSSEFGLEQLKREKLQKWWGLPSHTMLAITLWQYAGLDVPPLRKGK
jgi:hypothetical protein